MPFQSIRIYPVWNDGDYLSKQLGQSFCNLVQSTQPKSIELIDSAEKANIILFFYSSRNDTAKWIRKHPLISDFPQKCMCFSEVDRPFSYLPGIYVSASCNMMFRYRVRSYNYITFGKYGELRNDAIENAGNDIVEKYFLFSFMGRLTHRCRRRILELYQNDEDLFIDSPDYNHWLDSRDKASANHREKYRDVARQSYFALCPRGDGLNSIRLFEMMEMGICPVIISDNWLLPKGPDWNSFAVFVKERDVSNLKLQLSLLQGEATERGRRARQEWEQWFAPEVQADRIGGLLKDILGDVRYPEKIVRKIIRIALLPHLFFEAKVLAAVILHRIGIKKL